MSNEATVSGTALPAFDRIRAGEVETRSGRCSIAIAARSQGSKRSLDPTFENTVLPLEQLSHRLSRHGRPSAT